MQPVVTGQAPKTLEQKNTLQRLEGGRDAIETEGIAYQQKKTKLNEPKQINSTQINSTQQEKKKGKPYST